MPNVSDVFRVGITPDFFVDAKGRFEAAIEEKLDGVTGLEWASMPPQPGHVGTADAIGQFDAIFCLKLDVDEESLRGIERTALIARWGVGYDNLDVDALTRHDVALAITPNAVRRPVAEAELTLIFALAKDLLHQDRITREGKWRGDVRRAGRTMAGRTLGSVGCGNIGLEMFRLARSLGFGRFVACDPYVKAERVAPLGVELTSLDEVLRASDFVVVNTLLNKDTRGLIGEPELAKMRPDAFLINTARGPIVDEAALIRALAEHRIAGAGLDVFEDEPPAKDNPLLAMDNVILSPHGLAWTEEIVRDNGLEACDNILSVFQGEPPATLVNREVLARPGFQAKLERYRGRHG